MEYQELIERLRYERANDPEKMMRDMPHNAALTGAAKED